MAQPDQHKPGHKPTPPIASATLQPQAIQKTDTISLSANSPPKNPPAREKKRSLYPHYAWVDGCSHEWMYPPCGLVPGGGWVVLEWM
ncbi:MAG: hypothetical protein WCJ40_16370, partial [Planctomycetota bacterium]